MSTKELSADNLYLAAFLHVEKISILRIERSGRLGTFIFPEDKARDLMVSFFSKSASVEPQAYAAAIRELREMVDQVATVSPPAGCRQGEVTDAR